MRAVSHHSFGKWVTQPVTGVSWLGTKEKFAAVCCHKESLVTNVGTGSSLLAESKVTHITVTLANAAWEGFINLLYPDAIMTIWTDRDVLPEWPDYLGEKHRKHTSIYHIHGTKSDLRLLRSGSFFSPKSFIAPFWFLPSCFLPLGFCVVNGGESLKAEKGRDATLGKLPVKDRGVDGWWGWAHERMAEERKE